MHTTVAPRTQICHNPLRNTRPRSVAIPIIHVLRSCLDLPRREHFEWRLVATRISRKDVRI